MKEKIILTDKRKLIFVIKVLNIKFNLKKLTRVTKLSQDYTPPIQNFSICSVFFSYLALNAFEDSGSRLLKEIIDEVRVK
jgi:hypothetical protein